jgi:hypothetical protein
MSKNVLKSMGAVLAGFIVGAVLSLATDVVLHAVGVYPPWGQVVSDPILSLATAYRTVFGVVGAYVTARLAPDRPMLHALVLGALGFVASLLGAVLTWNKGPAYGPHWYPVALVVLALPTAWLGGWFREKQLGTRTGNSFESK